MVGRADRDHHHRRQGARAPNPDPLVPRHRLSQLSLALGLDRTHALPLPLHGLGLFRIPRAGDFARRMFQGARRAVGASRAVADDDAGLFPRDAADIGMDHFHRRNRRVRLFPDVDSVRGPIRCRRVRPRRAGSVRVLLSDLGRHADQPQRLLRADVAASRRAAQLDMIAYLHSYRRRRAILLCAVFPGAMLAAVSTTCRAAAEQKNLLLNGDFAKGSEDQPDLWRTEAWINKPDAFVAHWHSYPDKPSELEVDNLQADDGRWMQSLTVQPGWYQLSVDLRTENVGAKESGATIS